MRTLNENLFRRELLRIRSSRQVANKLLVAMRNRGIYLRSRSAAILYCNKYSVTFNKKRNFTVRNVAYAKGGHRDDVSQIPLLILSEAEWVCGPVGRS